MISYGFLHLAEVLERLYFRMGSRVRECGLHFDLGESGSLFLRQRERTRWILGVAEGVRLVHGYRFGVPEAGVRAHDLLPLAFEDFVGRRYRVRIVLHRRRLGRPHAVQIPVILALFAHFWISKSDQLLRVHVQILI